MNTSDKLFLTQVVVEGKSQKICLSHIDSSDSPNNGRHYFSGCQCSLYLSNGGTVIVSRKVFQVIDIGDTVNLYTEKVDKDVSGTFVEGDIR